MFTPSGTPCTVARSFGVPAGVLGVLDFTVWKIKDTNRFFLTIDDTPYQATADYLSHFSYERFFEKYAISTLKGIEDTHIKRAMSECATLETNSVRRTKNPKYYSDSEPRALKYMQESWAVVCVSQLV